MKLINKLTMVNKHLKVLIIVPDERNNYNRFKENSYFSLIKENIKYKST